MIRRQLNPCDSTPKGVQTQIVIKSFRWELIYQRLIQWNPKRGVGVERESGHSQFWSAEEPTELETRQDRELHELEVLQMQGMQGLEKGDSKGLIGSVIGRFTFYLIQNAVGLLILFLLFILIDLFFGEILIDMIFEDACFGFPGEDCS